MGKNVYITSRSSSFSHDFRLFGMILKPVDGG